MLSPPSVTLVLVVVGLALAGLYLVAVSAVRHGVRQALQEDRERHGQPEYRQPPYGRA